MNRRTAWGAFGLAVLWGCFVFCYLNACGPLWSRWLSSDYIHGYVVVPFALFLLWYRRELMPVWTPGTVPRSSGVGAGVGSDADGRGGAGSENSENEEKSRTGSGAGTRGTSSRSPDFSGALANGWVWLRTSVLARVVTLFVLGTVIQIAGQICWFRIETVAMVASRDTIAVERDVPDDSDVEVDPQEIRTPEDLVEVLKYGVPGVAVQTSREQLLQSVQQSCRVNAFQRGFAKCHGDHVTLILGWLCFAGAAVLLVRRELTTDGTTVAMWLDMVRPGPIAVGCGILFLCVGGLCRILGSFLSDPVLYPASMVPLLLGVALLIGGRRLTRWTWPSIVFLVFMIPLPELLSIMFADKLQLIGTSVSVWLLQLGGVAADASGNVIMLPNGHRMGVIEACSGLKMLVLFFCICTAGMFLMKGSLIEKIVVFCSAIPIAMVANIARITITGFLYMHADSDAAERFFHDGAGAFMAPFAMLLLWGEIELLGVLLVPVDPDLKGTGPEPAGDSTVRDSGNGAPSRTLSTNHPKETQITAQRSADAVTSGSTGAETPVKTSDDTSVQEDQS
ncbi:MAG: archaeosortase/exosortase family protein [Planctomycetia bacterium]|nr:archaeosortase/exosortase family protein [Planctomycetia bacterium]